MIANLTDAPLSVAMSRLDRGWKRHRWSDLIGEWVQTAEELSAKLLFEPYQVVWLIAEDQPAEALPEHEDGSGETE